jgi:hypothetical protein
MPALLGWAFLPESSRSRSRNAAFNRSKVPSIRHFLRTNSRRFSKAETREARVAKHSHFSRRKKDSVEDTAQTI